MHMPRAGTSQWSAVHRKDRHVLESIDTNMLIEAWHHVLKGKFMRGKRNRRLDQLIYILVKEVVPFYAHKHLRQKFGFEGLNLEMKQRQDAEEKGLAIPKEHVQVRILIAFRSRPAINAASSPLQELHATMPSALRPPPTAPTLLIRLSVLVLARRTRKFTTASI